MRAAYIEGLVGTEVIHYGARAHTLTERGDLPRLPDQTVGRLVLRPDH